MQGSGDLYEVNEANCLVGRIQDSSSPTADKLKCACNAPGIPSEAWANLALTFCEVNNVAVINPDVWLWSDVRHWGLYVMRLDANDVVDCPWCHQGMVVSPLPGDPDECQHCGGFGLTLLHVRCYCGRQMNLTKQVDKGVFYCGRPSCGDAIKKALGIVKPVATRAASCGSLFGGST